MKRHPSLFRLSHHHQHVLVQAKRLGRARGEEPDKASAFASEFLALWESRGADHFREEEEILLPMLARHARVRREEISEMLFQHAEIRSLIDRIAEALDGEGPLPVPLLVELGESLERHVRLEEQVIFPLVEATLPQDEMDRLRERLEQAS